MLCFPSKREQISFWSLPIAWNRARLQSVSVELYWIPDLQHLLLPARFQVQAEGEVSAPLPTISFWETAFPASSDRFASKRLRYFRQRQLFRWLPTAKQQYFHSKLHPQRSWVQTNYRYGVALAQLKLTLATYSLTSYHEWLIVHISRLVHKCHPRWAGAISLRIKNKNSKQNHFY